jgi:hypothetical protein
VGVSIHPGLVNDDVVRSGAAAAVAEAITDAFLSRPNPEAQALIELMDSQGEGLIADTEAEVTRQLANIDSYFERFKMRLHGVQR